MEFAYNSRPHKVTGFSPFEMNYGMTPLSPGILDVPLEMPKCGRFS